MATSSAHPVASRNYNAHQGSLADRSKGGAFGISTAAQQRENQRIDRERERLERERLEREAQDPMAELTEEQRDEINQAV